MEASGMRVSGWISRQRGVFGPRAALVFGALGGVVLGVGGFTFHYAEGFSYLGSNPRTCVNCHIMRPQFDAWQKSSHHSAAGCVDCHLPHGLARKYLAKADNGFRHSKGFTLQDFREPIRIKPRNSRILEENCLRCHGDVVRDLVCGDGSGESDGRCVRCHWTVGHGDTAGLGGPARDE